MFYDYSSENVFPDDTVNDNRVCICLCYLFVMSNLCYIEGTRS